MAQQMDHFWKYHLITQISAFFFFLCLFCNHTLVWNCILTFQEHPRLFILGARIIKGKIIHHNVGFFCLSGVTRSTLILHVSCSKEIHTGFFPPSFAPLSFNILGKKYDMPQYQILCNWQVVSK